MRLFAYHVATRVASDAAAEQQARSASRRLVGELQKFRLIPLVLTEYPDVRTVLGSGDAGAARRMGARDFTLGDTARRHLIEHDWPGNVRELRNFAYSEVLGPDTPALDEGEAPPALPERVAQFEATLAFLRIPRKTLYDKIARHGIDPKIYRG